jgi:integrase
MRKKAELNNYGGNLEKRWYIDSYSYGEKKRLWIKAKPNATRYDRAFALLQQIIESHTQPHRGELFEQMNNVLRRKELRKRSYDSYKNICKAFADYVKKPTIKLVTETDVNAWLKYQIENFADKTIDSRIICLRAIFKQSGNPCFDNVNFKLKHSESEFNDIYTEYERSVIEPYLIANNYPLYLATRFLFYSFLRPNELINIRVADIDLRTKTIRIHHSISKVKKTDSIAIIKPLFALIQSSEIMRNPGNFYLFGKLLKPGIKRISKNEITNQHREMLVKLNLYRPRETVFYGWKHTGNVTAYLAGMDIKAIQRMNRHKSLETTEIYLRRLGLYLDRMIFDFEY